MFYVVFFFKQKTAYEMRISDWSSDVCSSDLNVLVTRNGKRWQLRLADFGSGRLLDPQRLEQLDITAMGLTVTQALSGDSRGTVLYLAPELLSGAAPKVRSELYALGRMLSHLSGADLRRPRAPGGEAETDT